LSTGRSIRAWSILCRAERARSAGRRGPPTRPPPASCSEPCASRRLGRVLSSNTPRATPQRPQPRGQNARPSASYSGRAPQRAGRPTATTTSSFHQHPYHIYYYLFGWGIFWRDGFSANNRLPKPPRGHCPVRRFSIPQDLAFSAAILLRGFATASGVHLPPVGARGRYGRRARRRDRITPRIMWALLQHRQFSRVAKGLASQYAAALPLLGPLGVRARCVVHDRNAGLNHII
jgi:hypothetical protein